VKTVVVRTVDVRGGPAARGQDPEPRGRARHGEGRVEPRESHEPLPPDEQRTERCPGDSDEHPHQRYPKDVGFGNGEAQQRQGDGQPERNEQRHAEQEHDGAARVVHGPRRVDGDLPHEVAGHA
jgi:hypothetical protein